jgi:hypothetical protein
MERSSSVAARIKELQDELKKVRGKIDSLKSLLAEAKAGTKEGEGLDQECLRRLLDNNTDVAASHLQEIKRLEQQHVREDSKNTNSSRSTIQDVLSEPPQKRQQITIFAAMGLSGPRIAPELKSTSICKGCKKDCVNSGGLISHEKY